MLGEYLYGILENISNAIMILPPKTLKKKAVPNTESKTTHTHTHRNKTDDARIFLVHILQKD